MASGSEFRKIRNTRLVSDTSCVESDPLLGHATHKDRCCLRQTVEIVGCSHVDGSDPAFPIIGRILCWSNPESRVRSAAAELAGTGH